jgi:GLPGLI family protein
MKTIKFLSLFLIAFTLTQSGMAQKKVSECTIVYDIQVQTDSKEPQMADMFDGATTTVYIKGNMSRSELVSSLGMQSTIIDTRTGNVVVLKEYGDQKYLIRMTKANWEDANKKYEGLVFTNTDETKVISGYKCQKAIGKMSDGKTFSVFYTTEIIPENKDFEYAYKSLPGLAMEYETQVGSLKIKYTVSKINLTSAVPVVKFDIPKAGYRELTYEESRGKR